MADIFAGTQPPAWLTEATRQKPGQLGNIIGTLIGGLLNSAERDPNAPAAGSDKDPGWLGSRKGVKEGLAEARLNQTNPLWQLQAAQLQAATMGRMAQAETAFATAQGKIADTAAWMQDAPTLTPWLTARPEDRATIPAPAVRSKAAATLIERTQTQDSRYFIGKEANRIKEDTSRIAQENAKRGIDWGNAVGAATPEVQAQIAELPNQGWINDGQGKRLTPSTEALGILNGWRASQKLLPFGAKQTEIKKPDAIEVEKARQTGRSALETQRQTGRTDLETQRQQGKSDLDAQRAQEKSDYEEQRQTNRKDLLADASKYKIDLEKMKLDLKTGKDGKTIGKDEFINRHYNTVFNAIMKDSGDALKSSRQTGLLLERAYDTLQTPKAGAAAQPLPAGAKTLDKAPSGKAEPLPPNTDKNAKPDPLGLYDK